MKRIVTVALRNDSNQLLVAESEQGLNFPMYTLEASQSAFKVCSAKIREEFGFEVRGINPMRETFERKGFKIEGISAYISGGKLLSPLPKPYISASWIAPSAMNRLLPESDSVKYFIRELLWISGVSGVSQ